MFSQLIAILSSPILTRIFSPESFGIIAFFMALVSIGAVIGSLRFENVIYLAKEKDEANVTLNFLLFTSLSFSLLLLCLIIFFYPIPEKFGFKKEFNHWWFWVPIMIFLNSSYFGFRNWIQARKGFKITTKGGILKSLFLNLFLLLCGFFSNSPEVFLVANVTAQSIETIFLWLNVEKGIINLIPTYKTKELFKRYIDFPKFSLPADLLNVYTNQNPIILLAFFFNANVVGFYSLTNRVLGLPIKLISSSTLEVYKQKASLEYKENGNCKKTFFQTLRFLLTISILPTLVIFIFSPYLFEFVFGNEWREAGKYAQFLAILFFFRFCISPLGFTLIIAEKQKWNLYWQIALLFITSFGLMTGIVKKSPSLSIILYSLSYSFMYVIYFFMSMKLALKRI